jgi:hypothetical protein
MLKKLSTDEYQYWVTHSLREDGGPKFVITLIQKSTGKEKEFIQHHGDVDGIMNHMASLTDDLCSQWFNVREPKKKEKKNAVQNS